jgi:hypothetical protein
VGELVGGRRHLLLALPPRAGHGLKQSRWCVNLTVPNGRHDTVKRPTGLGPMANRVKKTLAVGGGQEPPAVEASVGKRAREGKNPQQLKRPSESELAHIAGSCIAKPRRGRQEVSRYGAVKPAAGASNRR